MSASVYVAVFACVAVCELVCVVSFVSTGVGKVGAVCSPVCRCLWM